MDLTPREEYCRVKALDNQARFRAPQIRTPTCKLSSLTSQFRKVEEVCLMEAHL